MGKDEDLYNAAFRNDVAAIRRLVAPRLWGTSANVNCTPYKDGSTPLHRAAYEGHVDAVRALLGAGANVDAQIQDGATPLHIAAQNGHVDAVGALLGARPNVDAPRQDGVTPLYIAAQNGHVDAVRALLRARANVDAPMQTGATPLYIAAQNGHVDAVRALLGARANVDAPTQVDNVAEALADAKQGAFGGVVQAQWGRSKVAVKVYNYKGLSPGDCTEAVTEAVLLSKANHPNIVHCYGVVYDPDTAANDSIQGSLVLEWVGGGNLSDWLQDNPQRGLGLKGRLLLALSVTEGMQHLHEKKLVHGDLKPQNILMCSKRAPAGHVVPQVKICNFGLSVYTSSTLTQAGQPTPRHAQAYTLAYTSPERTCTYEPSRKDDVYAFGILLYFIATGRTPFLRIPRDLLKEAIQSNTRPKIDEWLVGQAANGPEREVAERYCELAKQCWVPEPRDRPTFDDVHGRLSAMLQRLGS